MTDDPCPAGMCGPCCAGDHLNCKRDGCECDGSVFDQIRDGEAVAYRHATSVVRAIVEGSRIRDAHPERWRPNGLVQTIWWNGLLMVLGTYHRLVEWWRFPIKTDERLTALEQWADDHDIESGKPSE